MLGRSVNAQMSQRVDYTWPFAKTANLLQSADITFINLEGPIKKDCPVTNFGLLFCIDSRSIAGFTHAGMDIVSLANNHAGDQGAEGITSSLELLAAVEIGVVGITNPYLTEVKGAKFAFLGYTDIPPNKPSSAVANELVLGNEIAEARGRADIVIVMFHWGSEYTYQPTARQRELAHLSINAGADLVLGNHPHWYQPVEQYQGKFIVYSHGNFVFDQMWSRKTREGIVGKYVFYEGKLISIEFLPVVIYDYGQPRVEYGSEGDKILQNLQLLSEHIEQQR